MCVWTLQASCGNPEKMRLAAYMHPIQDTNIMTTNLTTTGAITNNWATTMAAAMTMAAVFNRHQDHMCDHVQVVAATMPMTVTM